MHRPTHTTTNKKTRRTHATKNTKKGTRHGSKATLILPGLWLGSEIDERNDEWMREQGITHDVHATHRPPKIKNARVHRVRIDDLPSENIYAHFDSTCTFIDRALSKGGNVFVHCQMGISRSTTLVAAYLMKKRGMGAKQAIAYIEARRPIVNPNSGFRRQLTQWEQHLRSSSGRVTFKRRRA